MVENEKPKLTRQLAEHIEDEFKHPNSKLTADVERWGEDTAQAMTRLCRAFPTLRGAPGSEPWDALPFLHWLCTSAAVTPACYHAGKFVLQIWDAVEDWQAVARATIEEGGLGLSEVDLEPFNIVAARARWDEDHTAAFASWIALPFWPERLPGIER